MAEGLENTECVIVFVTKVYEQKINGYDARDNCKYEFGELRVLWLISPVARCVLNAVLA